METSRQGLICLVFLCHMLVDNHNRPLTYLRLAITDKCNLRCFYCMPEKMDFLPKKQILSYEEMLRVVRILAEQGVYKIRLTGGEPFVRKDFPYFLQQLIKIPGVREVHITTNGVLTNAHIPLMEKLRIRGVNLSLDSLDADNFYRITRRKVFDKVQESLFALQNSTMKLKVNMVVMNGQNEHEIVDMARLTTNKRMQVRFIEEMPFNGTSRNVQPHWNWKRIHSTLLEAFPKMEALEGKDGDTAQTYKVPGFCGTLGIIPAFSRTFCGTCNRIRITATGSLNTCLYGDGVLSVRDLLRSDISDNEVLAHLKTAFNQRHKDGFAAEKTRQNQEIQESMSTIGG